VNRPFYAFGALLAALALAMLAVSSTSRSTSVSNAEPAVQPAKEHVQGTLLPRNPARFCGYVVVLPAGDDDLFVATNTSHDGCWPCEDMCPLASGICGASLVAAPVQLATHDPALLADESSRDCRSHYDAEYDLVVHGEVDQPRKVFPSGCVPAPVEWSEYADLLDEARETGPTLPTPAELTTSVRSGRPLLDFAATSLTSASRLLQFAADELRRAAESTANQPNKRTVSESEQYTAELAELLP
jgi:hypothetical protein